jgi:16S rRNA (adenine1518-N6/adenine1519-N6)-dimethyltransferase
MNNLANQEYLKNYLRSSGLRPKDYLGQNFLVDEEALAEIIAAGDIKKSDTVLEIGPGLGILTKELAERAGEVVAVEKDRNLVPLLKKEISRYKNVTVINQDILIFDFQKYFSSDYKVVANIPYYLTSKLINNFLNAQRKPSLIVLLVQKEVGERIAAAAGELSILGISVQLYSDPEIIATVPKDCFWPRPNVDSCIIRLKIKNKYPEIKNEKLFFRILKMTFSGKRKQIHNTLAGGLHLNKEQVTELLKSAGIKETERPQDLSIQEWIKLYSIIESQISGQED